MVKYWKVEPTVVNTVSKSNWVCEKVSLAEEFVSSRVFLQENEAHEIERITAT